MSTTSDTMDQVNQELNELDSEENQSDQNGIVSEEKEILQKKLEQLQALYESTKHELDSTREALTKMQSTQGVATCSSVETEESCMSESHSQDTTEHDSKQIPTSTPPRKSTYKIFVGNLSDYTTRSDLRKLFEGCGTVVEADIVKNYGFVHMETEEECQAAIDTLDGHVLHGKPLDVKASTGVRKSASDQQGSVDNSVTSARKSTFKIFVGNLSDFATSTDIREVFETYGRVAEADVMKNYGFVHMKDEEEGQAAIRALNGHMLRGKPMVVEASTGTRKNGNQMPKIFVGNVHRDCRREELKSLFEEYGKVIEVGVLTNYAFVHMNDEADAQKAIRELDGHELHGLRLTVQKSTSRGRQQGGMGYQDSGSRYLPGDRGGRSLLSRYEPYPPPPPPHRYSRERMMPQRDMYEPRLPPLPPDYLQFSRLATSSRYSLGHTSLHSYNPSDRRPY
ncbi:polyadenylate-binding protein 3 isoform X1 [Procambarus clarkii]|uniref:polyadenylate-binding protein 3 isoform X1 n=2 Tax=Procambarus clarkii TaxID=6728 RepID=UPI001E6760A1|nr:polyadenylate-binding protein 3-like isoform X1 [Procambarus clarkii]XP_045624038.1 polyadenylate-binding protein 3-like isoform X1 [Procambarus clarkii]XP_045624039.1 polyadenylate-binding protein 3-like isoform X1 [Procambarus clarkii]XP_045624040.1 polyadenylate-binding protein 3-like isoform X1 [Procambarus clarkii]XP_045624041.1 polyadenylate-binding protein 3-like isoform X1 [Procambarus clarkii]XP_045624042.1 polyadenylate-binding protein 3-like isoform X1 [Procambarus clarkii]XP_04